MEQSRLRKIERLDGAANFLMLVSDGETELKDTCGLSGASALELMGPLHAMIDEESAKGKQLITDAQLAECSENCHCGLYSDLAANKALKDDLFKKTQNFPRQKLINCAQKTAQWFCHDKLLDQLKDESRSFVPDAL